MERKNNWRAWGCKTCNAEPGETCRWSNGEARAKPHDVRWKLAAMVFALCR
jgi:hypothetical protein